MFLFDYVCMYYCNVLYLAVHMQPCTKLNVMHKSLHCMHVTYLCLVHVCCVYGARMHHDYLIQFQFNTVHPEEEVIILQVLAIFVTTVAKICVRDKLI